MNWDSRLTDLGIRVQTAAGARYALRSAVYVPAEQAANKHEVQYKVLNADGSPAAGVSCFLDWTGRVPADDPPARAITDANGEAHLELWSILRLDKKDGPYFAWPGAAADVVYGLGLPENRHVVFQFTWQWQEGVTPPPPAPPPPEPGTVDLTRYIDRATIAGSLRTLAQDIGDSTAAHRLNGFADSLDGGLKIQ